MSQILKSARSEVNVAVSQPNTISLCDTPIRNKVQRQQDEINELRLFEQLEGNSEQIERNRETYPHLSYSFLQTAMSKDLQENLLLQFKVGLGLNPQSTSSVVEQDEEFSTIHNTAREHSFSSESVTSDESRHVHFAQEAVNIENNNSEQRNFYDSSAPIASHANDTTMNTSSPIEKSSESFRRFKEKLFDRKLKKKFQTHLSIAKNFELSDLNSDKEDDDLSLISSIDTNTRDTAHLHEETANDVVEEQSEQIKIRLHDLELEIRSFREQNTELTKLIREHDLIRLTFDEERRVAQEKLEDDRVKFEMYMHDERLKLLKERTELEKRLKESAKPTRTERDELARLREQCSNHEKELITRDQNHVAAQGRIRAQLRVAEKDLKELQVEVENLRRENKKLETENVRLRRQNNNKMLQEINRNIAKLAPPNVANADNVVNNNNAVEAKPKKRTQGVKECSNKSAHKTVVAKVTSHRSFGGSVKHLRSKSVPDLQKSEKISCSTGTSPSSSDAEFDDNPYEHHKHEETDYFGKKVHNHLDNDVKSPASTANTAEEVPKKSESALKRVIENPDGSKDIWYPNGNLKKISADAMRIRMLYFNRDIKETNITEGTVKYYYAETNTWHTSYLDGLEILEFPR